MPCLAQTPERYLHSPRLVRRGDGADLLLIAWEGEAESVLAFPLSAQAQLGEPRRLDAVGPIVSLTRGSEVRVVDDPESELQETRRGHRVWAEHAAGVGSVWLASPGRAPVLVFRGRGALMAPCLAVGLEGVWVAFHHDVREDSACSDVAKWIALRFVDAQGVVHEPEAEMSDRDRDLLGVEQSFEFPALVLGDDGALSLFGRGSHNFYRQDLNAAGFSRRIALSDGQWGSRGRHIAAIAVLGGIVVARRDRKGIEVDLLAAASGGAPALRPAVVDLSARAPAVEVSAPTHDPARARGCVTLFGDIQQHSAHSDGLGSAHEAYLRARYRYGDDFVALTDHESFLGKRTGPGEWEYLQRVADIYDAPGEFNTLLAYEWTGKMYPGPGHKCVYFPERGLPLISRDDVPEGKELVQRVRAVGGFASPHHIGWTGADEAGHDDEGQPLWEICSCHGCYEHADHPLGQRGELKQQVADVMLRRGHRFGFTASSDSHGLLWHHGEARKRDPYRTGLTAVQARSRSRADIMEALMSRRCYATSGARVWLDVSADGAPMGSAIAAVEAGFQVETVGTEDVARIELVSERGVVASAEPRQRAASLKAQISGCAFVYARVTQVDGEMAWSSPVFLGEKRAP